MKHAIARRDGTAPRLRLKQDPDLEGINDWSRASGAECRDVPGEKEFVMVVSSTEKQRREKTAVRVMNALRLNS
jgi:hypothetical protein